MSDVMFYGILRMPYEMAMNDEMSRFQFYQTVQQAVDRVDALEKELKRTKFAWNMAENEIERLQGHMKVEAKLRLELADELRKAQEK